MKNKLLLILTLISANFFCLQNSLATNPATSSTQNYNGIDNVDPQNPMTVVLSVVIDSATAGSSQNPQPVAISIIFSANDAYSTTPDTFEVPFDNASFDQQLSTLNAKTIYYGEAGAASITLSCPSFTMPADNETYSFSCLYTSTMGLGKIPLQFQKQ